MSLIGRLLGKQKTPVRPRRSLEELFVNSNTHQRASKLTGWSEFVRGYGIDTYQNKLQKREVFYQIMAFRKQVLGVGAERPA